MTQSLIHDLLLILTAGLLAGLVCRWLSISMLIGYLLAGVVLGQGMLGWVLDQDHQIEHFAEAGVFLLLFSIGLEFSLDDLARRGGKIVLGGVVQMSFVAIPVASFLYASGSTWQSSVLTAVAVAFSSTVLVFKALSERGQSEQPHGRRAIGILLFQDAALVPLLLFVPLLTGTGESVGMRDFVFLAGTSLLFVLAILALRYLLSHSLIPIFAGYRSPELVILFTIVSLGSVTLAAAAVGLPPAVGAFAAGLIFNGNRWTKQIDALVLPFRETFAAIFFVSLGLILDPRLLWNEPMAMSLTLFSVLVIKTLAAMASIQITGLPLRQALGMALGLAQIGEFAFVLALLGWESGVLTEHEYQRVVAIAVGSLILTPPLMRMGLKLISSAESLPASVRPMRSPDLESTSATIIGAGLIGRSVASQLETMGKDVCLVDFSSINLHLFALQGFRTVVGDATDDDILTFAKIEASSTTVVCVSDDMAALRIVRAIRRRNRTGLVIVRCTYQGNINKFRKAGADQVISDEAEASAAILPILEISQGAGLTEDYTEKSKTSH